MNAEKRKSSDKVDQQKELHLRPLTLAAALSSQVSCGKSGAQRVVNCCLRKAARCHRVCGLVGHLPGEGAQRTGAKFRQASSLSQVQRLHPSGRTARGTTVLLMALVRYG